MKFEDTDMIKMKIAYVIYIDSYTLYKDSYTFYSLYIFTNIHFEIMVTLRGR